MTPEQRFDRIEGILERMAVRHEQMIARQQYHDEAFERHDAQIKDLIAAAIADGENIRALVRRAEGPSTPH